MKNSESQDYIKAARRYVCIAYLRTVKATPITVLSFCEIYINRILIISAIVNVQIFLDVLQDCPSSASDLQNACMFMRFTVLIDECSVTRLPAYN